MQTNYKLHLRIMIVDSIGSGKEKYYWVKAGENNGLNFVSHFNFYAYPNTNEIKFFDTVSDTVLDLASWRKVI
ncbi:MAG: hypothetical protein H7250_11315, partial [Flavobacterium sp.]|nr:hypothetical protein [Flavobacterium sp.]